MVKTDTQIEEQIRAIFSGDTPWVTIVWDDPELNIWWPVKQPLLSVRDEGKE